MNTTRSAAAALAVTLFCCAAPLQAQQDNPQQDIAAIRAELAQLRLEVERLRAEREEYATFLEETRDQDTDELFAQWRAERKKLANERKQLANERNRLELARRALHQTTMKQAMDTARVESDQQRAEEDKLKPDWSVQTMVGLIDREGNNPTIFVRVGNDLLVAAESGSDIDTQRATIRGNFLNKSLAPWRYTFQINVLDENAVVQPNSRRPLGSWRYQTPLLGPGDLHQFEVTIPVEDVRRISAIQIVRVTADRPPTPQNPPAATTTQQNQPAPSTP